MLLDGAMMLLLHGAAPAMRMQAVGNVQQGMVVPGPAVPGAMPAAAAAMLMSPLPVSSHIHQEPPCL